MVLRAPWAVFDLDGTLADVRHRLPFLQQRPRDWDSFFDAAVDDPPLVKGVALAMESAQQCELAYVTGRPERCRADTVEWLKSHGLPVGRLLMRPEGDRRPARVTKLELLQQLARERPVALVVDDDEQVNAAYEHAGFRVRRADWMPAPAVLEVAQEREGRT
ncbi:LNS2 domain-containing protein [Streptomyces sp. CA-250714]|uniref:phosphatase domain-containing protein n=1 Tax=Streptomyces sp. CA-250714 TaxID=3240060 RepID=UPI003D8DFB2D